MMRLGLILLFTGFAATLAHAKPSTQPSATAPDILVLGDSQLSFGLGPAMLDFVKNLDDRCGALGLPAPLMGEIASVGVVGVRSTSLHSWNAQTKKGKRFICEKEKTWGSNAAVYGVLAPDGVKWRQMGYGRFKAICQPNRTAFEALFSTPRFKPKLIVMMFMGNADYRWAGSAKRADQDAAETAAALPQDVGCVFATTAPAYTKKTNKMRVKAQAAIRAGLERAGACQVVDGLTPESLAAIQGERRAFRRRKNGAVKDPFHPTKTGAKIWLDVVAPDFCRAIGKAWRESKQAAQTALGATR